MLSTLRSLNNVFAMLGLSKRKRRSRGRRNSLTRRLRMEALEHRELLAITVNADLDFADNDITDGSITLRDAVVLAPAGETIDFDPVLNGVTITLDRVNLGQIIIEGKSLTIDASMLTNGITIDADDPSPTSQTGDGIRIFNITDPTFGSSPPLVTLIGLTLTGGDVSGDGGAISSTARLVLRDCIIESNEAVNGGGIRIAVASGGATQQTLLHIQNSTITGNTAADSGGGVYSSARSGSIVRIEDSAVSENMSGYNGGALCVKLYESSSLAIEKSTISGNSAERDGGGVFALANEDSLNPFPTPRAITISQSLVSGNTASNRGGGIFTFNHVGSETLVQESRVTGNHVTYGNGGGIYAYVRGNSSGLINKPKFTITGSTVDNNDAEHEAGGIFVCSKHNGDFIFINSTVSANRTINESTGAGGGIFIARANFEGESVDAYLRNMTITQNTSATGGGVSVIDLANVRVRIANSIISENFNHQAAPNNKSNLVGRVDIANAKYNLVGTGSAILNLNGVSASLDSTNITDTTADTPQLNPLANTGGPTPTHSLESDSPALDAGDPNAEAGVGDIPLYDQRGEPFTRVFGGRIDIGAHEVSLPRVVDVVLNGLMPDDAGPWTRKPYSFAELVPAGKQLAPIFTYGVNTIQVVFSEDVSRPDGNPLNGGELTLLGTGEQQGGAAAIFDDIDFDAAGNIGTWTFNILGGDRYRIDIEASLVKGAGGHLDGSWSNESNGTLYDWEDDPTDRRLVSGSIAGMGGTSFQFMFALAAGDYDQNGFVDGDDFLLWQVELQSGLLDGDGDGTSSTNDVDVWMDHAGNYLSLQKWQGDYNRDGVVDARDYVLWRATFGSTTDLRADGSSDGTIDAADYVVWRDWDKTWSAWYVPVSGLVSLMSVVSSTSPPQVVNVTISGSTSYHDPYSFDAHDGSGEQLRTVPVGGADTISITFSEDVNVRAEDLRLVGLRSASVPTVAEFVYDMGTMTAMWRFENLVANDHYIISLSDGVTDVEGNRLDGEWVNPVSRSTTNSLVSEFPSGDGNAGGNFNFVITLLAGDADLSNKVNGRDYDIWELYWAQDGGFIEGDFDGNGMVTEDDLALLESYNGINLQTVWLLGDLDGDFDVDQSDIDTLIDNVGMSNPTWADGDLNGDNHVDSADLELMFAQYGLQLAVVS